MYSSRTERSTSQILKYIHDHGCPWNTFTSDSAAHGGHLATLQYLINNNSPFGCAAICDGGILRELVDCTNSSVTMVEHGVTQADIVY